MQISVITLDKQILDMSSSLNKHTQISNLKYLIYRKTGINPKTFILTYNDKKLSSSKLLSNIDKNRNSLDLKMVLKQIDTTAQIVKLCEKLPDKNRKREFINNLYKDKMLTNDQKILLNTKYKNNFSGKFKNNVAVSFIEGYKPYKSNQSYGISELISAGLINEGQQDNIKRKLSLRSNSSLTSSRLNSIPLKTKLSINEAVHIIKNSKVPLTKIQNLMNQGLINKENYPNIMNKVYNLHKNGLKK